MISVADFMTRDLVTVRPSDDVALAESLLRLGGIRHLPVVEGGRLVGLVTQRDLLGAGALPPGASTGPDERGGRDRPVAEVMTRDVTTIAPDAGLAQAARLMLERKFGCLPVCTPERTLVGIVTEADFVRFAADVVRDLDLVSQAVGGQEPRPS